MKLKIITKIIKIIKVITTTPTIREEVRDVIITITITIIKEVAGASDITIITTTTTIITRTTIIKSKENLYSKILTLKIRTLTMKIKITILRWSSMTINSHNNNQLNHRIGWKK